MISRREKREDLAANRVLFAQDPGLLGEHEDVIQEYQPARGLRRYIRRLAPAPISPAEGDPEGDVG